MKILTDVLLSCFIAIFLKDDQILVEADKELKSDVSVQRRRSFDGLAAGEGMSKVLNELAIKCSIVHKILSNFLESTIYLRKNLLQSA